MSWDPLLLSFQIAITATLIMLLVGVPLGALLALKKFPGRDLVDVVITAPMVMPPTVLGYYLLVAVGQHSFIGRAWYAIFGETIVFTQTGATIAAVIGAMPFVVK